MKSIVVVVLSLIGTAALMGLWGLNCSGPRPAVADVRLIPPTAPEAPYRVEALIRNDGRGPGEVAVTFRLRDRSGGPDVQTEGQATLDPEENTLVVAEIQAPAADYEPDVEVEYPPG